MIRVAFLGAAPGSFADQVRAHLAVPAELVVLDDAELVGLGDVEVLVTMRFTAAMSAAAPRLRLVQVPGTGLDRIERQAIPPAASLANVGGHETAIAEYVLGAMITLARSLHRVDRSLRLGRWESQWSPDGPPPPVWPELAGRTLGILGYGGIGQALARRARAFDMEVCAIRRDVGRSAADDLALLGDLSILDQVLRRADHLAVLLPLTPDTQGLVGRAQLALMKPTAILVNVARAAIVDEDALYEALATGRLGGAALDAWYRYPSAPGPTLPATRPFHELDNVLMTPHISGWTDGMMEARASLMAENITRTARGEPPRNLIAPSP